MIPGAPPARATELPDDNEDSIEEDEEEEEEEEAEKKNIDEPVPNPAMDEPVTTVTEYVIDIPSENIVTEDVYDPAASMNSY